MLMTTNYLNTPKRLSAPITEHWEWQTVAACRGQDSDNFFHPPGERNRGRRVRIQAAKTLCQTCPVIAQCLDHALQTREPYGIWGGRSEEERANILGLQSLRYPAAAKASIAD